MKKAAGSVREHYMKLHWYIRLVLRFSSLLSAGLIIASCAIYILSDVRGDYFYNLQYAKEVFSCAFAVLVGGLAVAIIGDLADRRDKR